MSYRNTIITMDHLSLVSRPFVVVFSSRDLLFSSIAYSIHLSTYLRILYLFTFKKFLLILQGLLSASYRKRCGRTRDGNLSFFLFNRSLLVCQNATISNSTSGPIQKRVYVFLYSSEGRERKWSQVSGFGKRKKYFFRVAKKCRRGNAAKNSHLLPIVLYYSICIAFDPLRSSLSLPDFYLSPSLFTLRCLEFFTGGQFIRSVF